MYQVSQEVAVASLYLPLEDPRHDPGAFGLLLLLGAGWGGGCAGGCMADDGGGFKCVLLCLPVKMQIKILNLIKIKSKLR